MPRHNRNPRAAVALALLVAFAALACARLSVRRALAAADAAEYTGKLEPELTADTQDFDQVVFRPLRDLSKVKLAKPPEEGAGVTAGRLFPPPPDQSSVLPLLLSPHGETPSIYAALDPTAA